MTLVVLLVRHAASVPPIPGLSSAEDNDRPLTPAGRAAAHALASQLRSEPITRVYSSPYRRSQQTVEPIAAMHGLSVVVLHDLRERRLAEATLEEQAFLETIKHSRRDPGFRLPGGESTDEVRRRAFDALDRIHDEARSGVVVAGTHGGVIIIVRWSLGIEFTVEQALEDPMPAVYRLWRERRRWLADEVRQNEP